DASPPHTSVECRQLPAGLRFGGVLRAPAAHRPGHPWRGERQRGGAQRGASPRAEWIRGGLSGGCGQGQLGRVGRAAVGSGCRGCRRGAAGGRRRPHLAGAARLPRWQGDLHQLRCAAAARLAGGAPWNGAVPRPLRPDAALHPGRAAGGGGGAGADGGTRTPAGRRGRSHPAGGRRDRDAPPERAPHSRRARPGAPGTPRPRRRSRAARSGRM
ncbi:MAG: Acyl-phosphate:glycerol-3-phosphate O-acyltransferase PlsY, partial [uncultured Gemmatimonadetes bacterium]